MKRELRKTAARQDRLYLLFLYKEKCVLDFARGELEALLHNAKE